MNTRRAFQSLPPDLPAPRLGAGLVALLVSGLVVLGASAVAGRFFWPAEVPGASAVQPGLIPADHAPQVWIWMPDADAPGTFAARLADDRPLPRLPGHAPLPRLAERYVPSPPAHAMAPPPVAVAEAPGAETAPVAGPVQQPAVNASLPPLVPPRRPPMQATPESVAGADAPDAPQLSAGLTRSLLPPSRPESIQRLAALPVLPQHAPPQTVALQTAAPAAVIPAALNTPPAPVGARDGCPATLADAIPRRPSGAPGGQAAIARLAAQAGAGRDNAIAQAAIGGNLPDFLRRLVPVTMDGRGADGRPARVTLCVMPDYLALGSDSDFVRVPLGLPAASQIAERFEMVLPTTRMVDAIHAQAAVRLRPAPMTPGAQMASTDYFLRHNATLEGQRRSAGGALGLLVSGHKKDLVLSNRLEQNPGRVAIYGWHQANGQPIQPLSTVHGAGYADYSHGIRLVSRTAFVNGRAVDLHELLGDRHYAGLISDEGPIAARLTLASLR